MRRKGQKAGKFILLFFLLVLTASAQDFKIRAKIDLVEVPVTIKGSGDKLVSGLTKESFIILEDGKPQTITNFTIDPVPLSAVVIVDTGLSPATLSKIQKTFAALAGAFSQYDEVAVYRYDKFVTRVLDFSHDGELVETAMKTLREVQPATVRQTNIFPGPFSIPGPVINGAAVVPPGQIGVITTSAPKKSSVLHDAIFAAAEDLATRERQRRKIVLVITDGDTSGSSRGFDETAQSLLEKNVQVFAVGVDLPTPFSKLSVLGDYAKSTGGDVFFHDGIQHIEQSYASATEEARNQYVLGYVSNNEVLGAGPVFRNIEVDVAGRNLKTIHRKGYYQYP